VIPEVANPTPDNDAVAYAKLSAFLAENGVNLPAAPRIKSYKTMDAAMRAIIKSEAFEIVTKDR
jgi:hypothetical protein